MIFLSKTSAEFTALSNAIDYFFLGLVGVVFLMTGLATAYKFLNKKNGD